MLEPSPRARVIPLGEGKHLKVHSGNYVCSINITQAHSFDEIIIVLVFVDALSFTGMQFSGVLFLL